MSGHSAVSQAAFEAKYRQSSEPWNLYGCRDERDRDELTLRWRRL
jgi:hypothetical protein